MKLLRHITQTPDVQESSPQTKDEKLHTDINTNIHKSNNTVTKKFEDGNSIHTDLSFSSNEKQRDKERS